MKKETRCLQDMDYDTYGQAEKDFVDAFGYELLDQPFGGHDENNL